MQIDAKRSPGTALMWMALLIALATIGRLVVHWPNFTPVAAVALFAGLLFTGWRAWTVPFVALLISDWVIGFYDLGSMAFVYAGMLLATAIGRATSAARRQPSLPAVGGASLGAALIFFVVSNFGTWLFGGLYPLTLEGLVACYVAAVPFFKYTLASTLLWTAVLVGLHHGAERFARQGHPA